MSLRPDSPSAYLEAGTSNDFYSLRQPSDRYFTSGKTLRFQWTAPRLNTPPDQLRRFELGLDHRMYTPYRIEWSSPQQIDRPYAALLLLQFRQRRKFPGRRLSYTGGMVLGWVGPSIRGEELQNWFHRLKGRPRARGWAYQLRDQPVAGLELGLEKGLYYTPANRQLLLVRGQAILNSLQQHLDVDLEYRLGDVDQYFLPLPTPSGEWRWEAYFRLGPRLVLGNQLITGTLRGPVADTPLNRRVTHLVLLRGEYGLEILRGPWRLRLSQMVLSPEYRNGTTHYRGEIALGYLWQRQK